jgi:long-chain fatty acid transport protein
VPELGYNRMINDRMSLGVTMYGNGGMNTDYPGGQLQCGPSVPPGNLLCGFDDLGVDLSQLVAAPTFAIKLGERNAIGASALIGFQRFNMRGIQAFAQPGFTIDPGAVTNNGHEWSSGFGVRVGWMAKLTDQVSLGAAYAPRMKMSKFEKYRGLFAEEGKFDLPENFNIGVAIQPAPGVTAAFDYQRINYSDVKAVGNPSAALAPFGDANGPGFGWRDVNVLKFGASIKASERITVLGGYNHTDNPISEADVTINILAPGVIKDHITFGAAFAVGAASELVLTYMHAFNNEVVGSTAAIFPGGGTDRIKMYQNSLGMAWTRRF